MVISGNILPIFPIIGKFGNDEQGLLLAEKRFLHNPELFDHGLQFRDGCPDLIFVYLKRVHVVFLLARVFPSSAPMMADCQSAAG